MAKESLAIIVNSEYLIYLIYDLVNAVQLTNFDLERRINALVVCIYYRLLSLSDEIPIH